MYHLAFETSCDDTSVAVFQDAKVLSLITKSQIREHEETQGVVPEVAARLHANVVFQVLQEALDTAGIGLKDIGFISCTKEPGLIPSLLVGKTVAKTLADSLEIPLYWIHHIEGHMFANFLERELDPNMFPAVVLTVSGGHNEIYLWNSLFEWKLLGQTRDDAAGEAFDKVAKSLGLGFPGGPLVAKLAKNFADKINCSKVSSIEELDLQKKSQADLHLNSQMCSHPCADITMNSTARRVCNFPIPLLEKTSLDFSFSGLKSAVKREIDERKNLNNGELSEYDLEEISYSFEQTIVATLVEKLRRAAETSNVPTLMLAGGVSANDFLRQSIEQLATDMGRSFYAPVKKVYSMDNAAMIGMRAYYEYKRANCQL